MNLRWLAILSLVIWPVMTWAAAGDATEELSRLLTPMQSLEGKFKQTVVDADGETLQESEGFFALERPGKFRWQTLAPYEQLLVSNQTKLWLYDPDLEQVTVRPVDEQMQQTPALLLSGEVGKIREHFRVQKLKGSAVKDQAATNVFTLQPNGENNLFEELRLMFEAGRLTRMAVLDSLGQTTTITLHQLVVNPVLDAHQFQFQPPPGTDVLIDDTPR